MFEGEFEPVLGYHKKQRSFYGKVAKNGNIEN